MMNHRIPPKPDNSPDLLLIWETDRWRYEICDNPNGPYLREVWMGKGDIPINPAVDPCVTMILHLLEEVDDLKERLDDGSSRVSTRRISTNETA